MKGALSALAVIALLALGIWSQVAAPCAAFRFSDAAKIPGRCVMPQEGGQR
jgi:hypothetical protein